LISRGDDQSTLHSFIETDLHTFIENIVVKLKPQVESKGLQVNLCEYQKLLVTIDSDNFERAILNILQNAIKYTKVGSVTIKLKTDAQKAYVVIEDTGVGIDQKDLPHVFDRFYKAEHSRSDSSSSGLGLPIAKLIIEEHKGNIQIDSGVNKGTIVTIAIPRK
jgi:signal transduction histidine kinase